MASLTKISTRKNTHTNAKQKKMPKEKKNTNTKKVKKTKGKVQKKREKKLPSVSFMYVLEV